MQRFVDMKEISDGRLYRLNDMVRADCGDCAGCSDCCSGMGTSIILDPLDVFHLSQGLLKAPEELLTSSLELHVVDGIILPNLRMEGEEERCLFLNEEGRCRIHPYRPGICRIFPLGRYYNGEAFDYFLQVKECSRKNRTKIKIWKWIDMPDAAKYDQYIADWHYYIKRLQEQAAQGLAESAAKQLNMLLLQRFFLTPYNAEAGFYEEFYERLAEAKEEKGLLV